MFKPADKTFSDISKINLNINETNFSNRFGILKFQTERAKF